MRYLFDTNILLRYIRNAEDVKMRAFDQKYNPLGLQHTPIVCVVSLGELKSLGKRNGWGKKRIEAVEKFLKLFVIVDIYAAEVLERYAEIDAFSQNKLSEKPLAVSARNMGKNDLWIAAVASVLDAKLLTNDRDFDHLNGVYLEVLKPDS